MRFPVIYLPFLPAAGMAIFPFVFIKFKQLREDEQLINHELIHLRQQIEMLIVPFYIIYFFNYLANLLYYRNHKKAYLNIVFEREAYTNDLNLDYLNNRKFMAWLRYFSVCYKR